MKSEFFKATGKIYSVDLYERNITNTSNKLGYSKDENFVFEYNDCDLKEYENMKLWSEIIKRPMSIEDYVYKKYVKEFCPEYSFDIKLIIKRLSEIEKTDSFICDDKVIFCLFNLNDSKTSEGSDAIFIIDEIKEDQLEVLLLVKHFINLESMENI